LKPIINIAILAHVDAGKTSLTEQLLFHAGAVKVIGNVDKGTAITDSLQVEKDRGISVASSHVSLNYNGVQINIIDTPGHADFMSEVERSLMAVDAVILIVSAADGVQAQTRVLWRILEKMKIPRMILINKVDRRGVILDDIVEDIKKELTNSVIVMQNLVNEGEDQVEITNLRDAILRNGEDATEDFIEAVAEYDDDLLEAFLSNKEIDSNTLFKVFQEQVNDAKLFPILFSVAKTGIGIQDLLNEMTHVFTPQKKMKEDEFSAVVFKISHHPQFGKLAHLRLFSGVLEKKQLLYNQRTKEEEKVNLLKSVFSDKMQDVNKAVQGEIIAVSGLNNANVGDVLGYPSRDHSFQFETIPILTVQVKPINTADYIKLSEALMQLNNEDPLLQFQWFKDENEFHLKINGWIQIEILKQLLIDRFSLETEFLSPSVIYKETPISIGFGYEEYTMPKPCWAVVKLKIEPGERGSGVQYESKVGVNDILLKYQKEVERTIPRALEQGVKGWEVSDLKITLIGGEDHVVHSRAGDFVIATPMAILNGLKAIGTVLLEPIMKFTIQGPEDILGQVTSDLLKMRGVFEQPELDEGKMKLKGKLPVATSLEYPVKLASRTGGRASIQMQFDSYQKVEDDLGEIREFKGISPLDRAKYILKARKAIQ
jgi:ribosomal protection tetracycline resistance protein